MKDIARVISENTLKETLLEIKGNIIAILNMYVPSNILSKTFNVRYVRLNPQSEI